MTIILYVLAWIPMVFIAIFNGTLRKTTYRKSLLELQAHQVSTLTAIILFSVYIRGLTYFFPLTSSLQALIIGIIWLGLTVTFEFTFGHYVAQHSWEKLLADYNLFKGRLWIMVLLWILIAPLLFYGFH